MTTNNPRLYLSISASLRSPTLNHAPLNKPNYQFPREIAASLLPKSINIKELREKKRSSIEKQRSENSIIRHVDGSKHEFKSDASKKLWIQPKQEEKLESQYYVKRLRHQEKIFSLLLLYFSTSKIPYILRKPIWRLTRIEPNHDLRSYQAFWVIEDEMESSQYLNQCGQALSSTENQVRHFLTTQLALKFVPSIKFTYEKYMNQPY